MSLYRYAGTLVRVTDGDTVVVDVDLGLRVWARSERVRLAGVNCPETSTPAGRAAAAATTSWFAHAGGRVWLSTTKASDADRTEKYGRWLAWFWPDDTFIGQSLNEWLVASGHATPYDGTGPR